jgi:hypothetical protein
MLANGMHLASDKSDLYVLRKCSIYLQRHLEVYPCFDMETVRLLCWILGEDLQRLEGPIASLMVPGKNVEFEEVLSDPGLEPEEYISELAHRIRRIKAGGKKKLNRLVSDLLANTIQEGSGLHY